MTEEIKEILAEAYLSANDKQWGLDVSVVSKIEGLLEQALSAQKEQLRREVEEWNKKSLMSETQPVYWEEVLKLLNK